jgi:hypothetical protein
MNNRDFSNIAPTNLLRDQSTITEQMRLLERVVECGSCEIRLLSTTGLDPEEWVLCSPLGVYVRRVKQ